MTSFDGAPGAQKKGGLAETLRATLEAQKAADEQARKSEQEEAAATEARQREEVLRVVNELRKEHTEKNSELADSIAELEEAEAAIAGESITGEMQALLDAHKARIQKLTDDCAEIAAELALRGAQTEEQEMATKKEARIQELYVDWKQHKNGESYNYQERQAVESEMQSLGATFYQLQERERLEKDAQDKQRFEQEVADVVTQVKSPLIEVLQYAQQDERNLLRINGDEFIPSTEQQQLQAALNVLEQQYDAAADEYQKISKSLLRLGLKNAEEKRSGLWKRIDDTKRQIQKLNESDIKTADMMRDVFLEKLWNARKLVEAATKGSDWREKQGALQAKLPKILFEQGGVRKQDMQEAMSFTEMNAQEAQQ